MTLRLVILAVLQGGASIIGPLVASTMLSASDLGEIALAFAAVSLMRPLFSLGLGGSISVLGFNAAYGLGVARHLLRVCLLVALLCLGLILFAAAWLDTAGIVLGTLAAGVAAALGLVLAPFLQSTDRQGLYTVFVVGTTALSHAAAILALVLGTASSCTYIGAFSVTTASTTVVIAAIAVVGPSKRSPLWLALRMGLPLLITGLSTASLAFADRPLVGIIFGPETLGVYFLIYLLSTGAIPIAASVSNGWLPAVLRVEASRRVPILIRTSDRYIYGFAALGLGLGITAPLALGFLSSPLFTELPVRILAAVLGLTAGPYTAYLSASIRLYEVGRTSAIMTATLSGALTSVLLTLVMGHLLGLPGVGLATMCGYCILAEVSLRLVGCKELEREVRASYLRSSWKCAAISALIILSTPQTWGHFLSIALGVVLATGGLWSVVRVNLRGDDWVGKGRGAAIV
jgi:O-antigen/teichoic acid export membrane protein